MMNLNVFFFIFKENFGFIETLDHKEEVFFHYSNFNGNPNSVELGQEVEYTLSNRLSNMSYGNCLPAENVKILPKGTILQPAVYETVHNGLVLRPFRGVNPDQAEYSGLIGMLDGKSQEPTATFEFGITSLSNKRDLLQKNDSVSFKLDEDGRAKEVFWKILIFLHIILIDHIL